MPVWWDFREITYIAPLPFTFSQKCPHHPFFWNSIIGISTFYNSYQLIFPLTLNALGWEE